MKEMKEIIIYLKNFVLSFFKRNDHGTTNQINQATELRIKVEEIPNKDILLYHVSDMLTETSFCFRSLEDLAHGHHGIDSGKVPEELQYLVGGFILRVKGLVEISCSKYKICFTKSSVFEWREMEEEILSVIKKMIGNKRKLVIKERVRSSIDAGGYAQYEKVR